MQVGNDIVCFLEAKELNPRFPQRILSPDELKHLESEKHFVLKAWAAKETGYKILKQIDPNISLLPKKFVYDPIAGTVTHGTHVIDLSFEATAEYIHCWGLLGSGECVVKVQSEKEIFANPEWRAYRHLVPTDLPPWSQAARLLAFGTAQEWRTSVTSDLRIEKDAFGIPRLFLDNHPFPLSISHHGSFAAIVLGRNLAC